MSLELPPLKVIEAGIVQINEELVSLESEARSIGLEPVKPEDLLVPEDKYTQISPDTTPAGFWSHHIGGPIYAVDAQMYL